MATIFDVPAMCLQNSIAWLLNSKVSPLFVCFNYSPEHFNKQLGLDIFKMGNVTCLENLIYFKDEKAKIAGKPKNLPVLWDF